MIGNDIISGNNRRGFTLVEAVVVIFIFTLIILSVTSLFVHLAKSYRQRLAIKEINEESQVILERISKEVRMAKIDSINSSSISPMLIIDITGKGSIVYNFKNKNFEVNNVPLNSNKVKITNGQFYIVNDPANSQPYVTIKFQVYDVRWPTIKKTIQTTISPRSGSAY